MLCNSETMSTIQKAVYLVVFFIITKNYFKPWNKFFVCLFACFVFYFILLLKIYI